MHKFCIFIFLATLYSSLLNAVEPKFKFTLGGNIGNIPLEINKTSQNIKSAGGIKLNSWTLSPNFLLFAGHKKSSYFNRQEVTKENLYIKIKFEF